MRDREVAAAIVAGNPAGLAAVYDRYADALYKYCRTLLRDPADAADAVQDTYVVAAARLDGLRDYKRLRAWFYAVARNECLQIAAARKGTSVLDEAFDVTGDFAPVSRGAERADLRSLFDDATDGLNPGDREVVELQLRAGLAPGEVADVLGVSRNHAHALASRAREQLETCLGVLLVSRASRGQCGELSAMLGAWDGRLTVLLRKRLHRHIEHCATCTAARAYLLGPSMLQDLSPGAALAAGAALSFRLAAGAPAGLRGHTLALATGHSPAAAAHSAAVLSRAAGFTKAGFPKPAREALAGQQSTGLAGRHAAGGLRATLVRRGFGTAARGRATVAVTVVVAAGVAVAAFALAGRNQPFTPSANPKPPAASLAASAQPGTAGASRQPPASPTTRGPAPATSKPAPHKTTPAPHTTSAAPAPATTAPAATTPPPSPSKSPSASQSPSAKPTPTPTGTLSESPGSGTLLVQPGSSRTITLSASGGPVSWSVTIANDPRGGISVNQASGRLKSAGSSFTLRVTVSQPVSCSFGCPTLVISPGGAAYTIVTGGHSHHGNTAAAPAAAITTALAYLTESRKTAINET